MSNVLVAYFSVSGVTEKVAKDLAMIKKADLYPIVPSVLYTKEDLDYTNRNSRSSVEMQNPDCRPELAKAVPDLSKYDVVFVGFPIWWGREPSVVDTFLTGGDFKGKRIIPFCTSGGSPIGKSGERIAQLTGAEVVEGSRLGGDVSEKDLELWTAGLNL